MEHCSAIVLAPDSGSRLIGSSVGGYVEAAPGKSGFQYQLEKRKLAQVLLAKAPKKRPQHRRLGCVARPRDEVPHGSQEPVDVVLVLVVPS